MCEIITSHPFYGTYNTHDEKCYIFQPHSRATCLVPHCHSKHGWKNKSHSDAFAIPILMPTATNWFLPGFLHEIYRTVSIYAFVSNEKIFLRTACFFLIFVSALRCLKQNLKIPTLVSPSTVRWQKQISQIYELRCTDRTRPCLWSCRLSVARPRENNGPCASSWKKWARNASAEGILDYTTADESLIYK